MSGRGQVQAAESRNEAQQQQQQGGGGWMSMAFRILIIYFLINYMTSSSTPPAPAEPLAPLDTEISPDLPQSSQLHTAENSPDSTLQGNTVKPKGVLQPLYPPQTRLDVRLYLIVDPDVVDSTFVDRIRQGGEKQVDPLWQFDVHLDETGPEEYQTLVLDVPLDNTLQNNGSARLVVVAAEWDWWTRGDYAHQERFLFGTYELVVYKPLTKSKQLQSLLYESEPAKEESSNRVTADEADEVTIVGHWRPNITINIISNIGKMQGSSVPAQIAKHLRVDSVRPSLYYPILYFNDFWLLQEDLIPLNHTLSSVPLKIEYQPLTTWWFLLYDQMGESLNIQMSLGSTERDIDDLKVMLFETNPYLLGLTVVVTLLHTVFDFLAFKNDIKFWKDRKSLEGLSVKSIFLNTIFQVIIFLYLVDNDTSFVVLVSSFIGLLIEAWKITKAVDIKVQYYGSIPYLSFQDKASYASTTKEYDDIAFKWLGRVLFPLIIGYSIYSLIYDTHRSWYSWVLSSLVGCVYTFGFIMMTPQLFINYKLKSVAHLPWRAFTYKALNTFIDDLFAFIIRMPTLHRLACLRDDLVFFIYLYQRWIYPVDKTRVNEFGLTGEDMEKYEQRATKRKVRKVKRAKRTVEESSEPRATREKSE